MSVIIIDEYEPSTAKVTLEDPYYEKSSQSQRIRIRAVTPPSPLGILILAGIFYFLLRK